MARWRALSSASARWWRALRSLVGGSARLRRRSRSSPAGRVTRACDQAAAASSACRAGLSIASASSRAEATRGAGRRAARGAARRARRARACRRGRRALEPGHAVGRLGRAVGDRDAGERVEAVGVDPDVGVRDPHRAVGRLAQARRARGRPLARRLVQRARQRGRRRPPSTGRRGGSRAANAWSSSAPARSGSPWRSATSARSASGNGWKAIQPLVRTSASAPVEHLRPPPRARRAARGARPRIGRATRPRGARRRSRARWRDRLGEQADRRRVVRAVRQRHAADAEHGRALLVVAGELGGAHAASGRPRRRAPACTST